MNQVQPQNGDAGNQDEDKKKRRRRAALMLLALVGAAVALGTLGGAIEKSVGDEGENIGAADQQKGNRLSTLHETTIGYEGCDECYNGGQCTGNSDSFTCVCAEGYEGDRCEDIINPCDDSTCQHGVCQWSGIVNEEYTCECDAGYEGHDCDVDVDDCQLNPCQNGGLCEDGVNSYTCDCSNGFEGNDCEINTDDCDPNPCQNGGVCINGIEEYTCDCPEEYIGELCQTRLSACEVITNGGCEHNCHLVEGDDTTRYCTCNEGYDLKLDEMSCDLICKSDTFPPLTIRCVTYQVITSSASWDGAKQGCENIGQKLFKIRDEVTANCITQYLSAHHPSVGDIWIGLRDYVGNGATPANYDWVADNTDLTGYQNWAPYEPNAGSQTCVQLWKSNSYRWDNDFCYLGKAYLCETEINLDDCEIILPDHMQ